jgi:hypothetical protein
VQLTVLWSDVVCQSGYALTKSAEASTCSITTACDSFTEITDAVADAVDVFWEEAAAKCQSLGMRLPNSSELKCMCDNKHRMPGGMYEGVSRDGFWSSSRGEWDNTYLMLYPYYEYYVRACALTSHRGDEGQWRHSVKCVK